MSAAERAVRQVVVASAIVVAGGLLLLPPAGAVTPTAGDAQVDGSVVEWGPGDDVAALFSNDRPHAELGRLALRYDCADEVLYALVTASPGVRLLATDPDEAYLRFGSEPKLVSGTDTADGDAPDAAWVDLADGTAAGIEMSAPLAPGTHPDLRAHAKVPNDSDDGYQTVDLVPRYQELAVDCPGDPVAAAEVAMTTADPPADPAADPAGLARTGAPNLPVLVAAGLAVIAMGLLLRTRPWARARP
jgi:hypothetical protein